MNFYLNNQKYIKTTDSNGKVSIPVSLANGTYDVGVNFEDSQYIGCENSSTITVISSIEIPDNAVYTLNSNYDVYLLDKSSNPLQNTTVTFIINNICYYAKTDIDGKASLTIPISTGNVIVKTQNPITGEIKSQSIQILPRLSENSDVVMYYGANKYYKVKVLDDNGQTAEGVSVVFNVDGINYFSNTDNSGYASFKISLKTGTHIIKATYKNFVVLNKITIKPTLITKNIKVKKAKTVKYSAKLLNSEGKVLKAKKIKFKIKGKTYKAKTNKKGIAKIKIKNLKVGKYIITVKYGKIVSKSKITVKK